MARGEKSLKYAVLERKEQMTILPSNTRVQAIAGPALPAAILVIFFISGTSALIDQIVWTRALYRIFGVTSLAASTVLAAFMAGLALGSYLFGRLIDRGGSPLKMYAVMELVIAVITPLTPWTFRALQPVYSSLAGAVGLDSPWLPILRGLLCFVVLLPATMLMGGTLPVLAKGFLRNQPGRITASLYSINTWGAVFGCFLAGFVLLGVLGETRSLLVASLGNLIAALWAWTAARGTGPAPYPNPVVTPIVNTTPISRTTYVVFIASFANGFAALALEVLWGRTLGLLTDASVYAYTGIIGMFLMGIALGSRLAGPFADRVRSPMLWLGALVWSMGVVLVVALRVFMDAVPHEFLGGESGGSSFPNVWLPVRVMLMAAAAVAPLTVLSGACFPFLVRLVVTSDGREGRQLGSIYSINTIGGIIGAIVAGFALLPLLADQGAFCVIALVYIASGALCLAATRRFATAAVVGTILAAMTVIFLPFGGSLSLRLVSAYGSVYKHFESASGTVTAFARESIPPPFPNKCLLVNGTAMTTVCTDTKVMAHLPLMLHPHPESVLVVCFGMGTTFRSAAAHDLPVTVVELQPSIPKLFEYFHSDAPAIVSNPKNQIKIGDGRNFLLLSKAKYSVITIDPSPPMYSAGMVNLYTQEFFRLCRDHLDDHGVMSLWIPGYSCMESDFRLIVKTFTTVFPEYALWIGPDEFGWYLVGSKQPFVMRPDRLQAIAGNERIRRDLTEYHSPGRMVTPQILLNEYMRFLSGKSAIDRYVADEGRTLTDDRPYTEFPMLEWIRYGDALQDQWFNLQKSLDRLVENPK